MSLRGKTMLLKTPLNPASGYGRDGIQLAQYLTRLGVDLHIEPKYVGLPLPEDILYLFAKPRPKHFDIALTHEYPGELAFPEAMPFHADVIVGWTMYEFTSFGDDNGMTVELRERLRTFDLLLAYDAVSRQSLAEYVDEENLPRLQVLQGGYDSTFWQLGEDEVAARSWDGTMLFAMNGTMNARKNPWIVLHAFRELKEEHGDAFDAELHMKTTSMIFPPVLEEWCPGLKIHFAIWEPSELRQFYSKINCLLAPSWGEGKNLPALEAQTMGVPVIASAFGGHMQWADPEWTYLVEGPIEEHLPRAGSMRVSMETVKEAIWHVYTNRAEAKLKGELASRMIPKMCDWEPILLRLGDMLDRTVPHSREALKKEYGLS